MTVISQQSVDELAPIVERYCCTQLAMLPATAAMRSVAERHGWHWMGLADTKDFNWRCALILRAMSQARYSSERRSQLADLPIWVFRADPECCPEHLDLDGIALPSSHLLWSGYYPPTSWNCSCYVVGASSDRGAMRLQGDPAKPLPDWWHSGMSQGQSRLGVHGPWIDGQPTLHGLLAEIAVGEFPQPSDGGIDEG